MKLCQKLAIAIILFICGIKGASSCNFFNQIVDKYPYVVKLDEPAITWDLESWEVVLSQNGENYTAAIYKITDKKDEFIIDTDTLDLIYQTENSFTQQVLEWGFNQMPIQYLALAKREKRKEWFEVGWYRILYINPKKEVLIILEKSDDQNKNVDFETNLDNLYGVGMKILFSSDYIKDQN